MRDRIRPTPCVACPYKRSVPSGVWSAAEYDKLLSYDRLTCDQPPIPFGCHADPDDYCAGWAIVHMSRGGDRELLAIRILRAAGDPLPIPKPKAKLFASGAEAAEYGKRDIKKPGEAAIRVVAWLAKRYDRLGFG